MAFATALVLSMAIVALALTGCARAFDRLANLSNGLFGGSEIEGNAWPTWRYHGPDPARPHRCPVCGGNGLVDAGYYLRSGQSSTTVTGSTNPETCRSCQGKGVLWE